MNDVHKEGKPRYECQVYNHRLTVANVHLHPTSQILHYRKYLNYIKKKEGILNKKNEKNLPVSSTHRRPYTNKKNQKSNGLVGEANKGLMESTLH